MDELTLISRQQPGVVALDNFDELKAYLERRLFEYRGLVYTPENLKEAKKDKATLTKLKKAIDERRKEIKRIYMEPYLTVEAQAKELAALIDEPLQLIADFVAQEAELEKAAKRKSQSFIIPAARRWATLRISCSPVRLFLIPSGRTRPQRSRCTATP